MNIIQKTAKAILQEAGELEPAKALARERFLADVSLARSLAEKAIDDALDAEWRADRQYSWPTMPKPGETVPPAASLLAGMRAAGRTLMDYHLPNGKLLGDCTKVELLTWGEQMIARGRNEILQGTWATNVAGLLKKDKDTPRAKLHEADLARMQTRALDAVLGGKAVAPFIADQPILNSAQPSAQPAA